MSDRVLFPIALDRNEAFARLAVAAEALKYEQRVVDGKVIFLLGQGSKPKAKIDWDYRDQTSPARVELVWTVFSITISPEREPLTAIQKFMTNGTIEPPLPAIALPEGPFLSPELLLTPYPRDLESAKNKRRKQAVRFSTAPIIKGDHSR